MGNRKYERDSKGRVILDEVNGIKVTRPWSTEMYVYNDDIQKRQKEALEHSLQEIYEDAVGSDDTSRIKAFGKIVCGYGHGYDEADDIYEDIRKSIHFAEKHWLREVYPEAVTKKFLVDNINKDYIGF